MRRVLGSPLGNLALVLFGTALAFSCRSFEPAAAGAGGAGQGGQATDQTGGARGGVASAVDAGASGQSVAGVGGDGAGGSGGEPETLQPLDFERLSLWLEATEESCKRHDPSPEVVQWLDGSSNGNNAESQDGVKMPSFAGDVLNHHGVVNFQAVQVAGKADEPSSLVIADDPASLALGTEDFALLVVMRWSNGIVLRSNGATQYYWGSGSIIARHKEFLPFRGIDLLANYPPGPFGGNSSTRLGVQLDTDGALALSYSEGLNDDTFRLCVARRANSDLTLRINGALEARTHLASGFDLDAGDSTGSENMLLGGVTARPFVGDIAEVVLIRGVMPDAKLEALERYLSAKYALLQQ